MSNQYKNALDHAYDVLKTDIDKYGIFVDGAERMIVWRGAAIPIKTYTPQSECLRILRNMIAEEKRLKTLKALESQERLL